MTLPKGYERKEKIPLRVDPSPSLEQRIINYFKKPKSERRTDEVITAKGRVERYYCDYCEKVFEKETMYELKWRFMSQHQWYNHLICRNCKMNRRLDQNSNGRYLD
jgi:RNase P subunit RPR2